jgi:predicted transcriptional regulator
LETDELGIPLKMSYELSARSDAKPNLSKTIVEGLKNGIGRILIPFHTIRGVSKTVSRSNPLCAASVRFNAETIFGIRIEPRETAEKLMESLVDQIRTGKRIGFV